MSQARKRKSAAIVVDYQVLDRDDGSDPNGTAGSSEPSAEDAAEVDPDEAPRSDIRG